MTTEDALNINFTGRLPLNLFMNILYFGLNIIVGLALVPFFLDTLGSTAYALIPLATSITSYLDVLVTCINTSVARFLTIDIHSRNTAKANTTFNTALFGTLIIVGFLIPIALLIAWVSPDIFSTGTLPRLDIFLLFALIFISVLITAWSANFMTTLTAYNRFDYRNYVNIARLGTQIILILLLFTLISPSLVFVGLAYFVASVIGLGFAYRYSRKVAPDLTISPKTASFKRFKEVGSLAVGEGANSLSWYLVATVALIIVNILFGAEQQTRYSMVTTWFGFILALSGLLIPLFVPMIFNYYARNNVEGMVKFCAFATKCMGVFFCLPIALLCIFSSQIMTWWVGEEYADLSLLVWIVLTPLVVKVQQSCLTAITTAYLKVHIKALIGLGLGGINIALAYILAIPCNLGVYGVAIAGAVTLFAMVGIVEPFYDAYLVKKSPLVFLKPMGLALVCYAAIGFTGFAINRMVIIDSMLEVIGVCGILSLIYLLLATRVLFQKEERKLIRECFPAKIRTHIPPWLLEET